MKQLRFSLKRAAFIKKIKALIWWYKIENSPVHLIVSTSNATFWQKLENPPMHLTVSASDAAFWHNRKPANAPDRLSVRCSPLTKPPTRQCIQPSRCSLSGIIEYPSVHLTASESDAALWQNTDNPPMHSIIRVQPFWHHRKSASAPDRLSVRCSFLANPKNPSMHLTYQRWMQPDKHFIKSSISI